MVVYEDPRSTSVSEEEIEALKYFDYIVNDDATIEIYEKTFMDDLPSDEIVRIPATIRGMPVTKWNAGICDYMKEIHIPASIRSIENLEDVTLWLHEPKLERIIVADDNPNYWADGQALYLSLIHILDISKGFFSPHRIPDFQKGDAYFEYEKGKLWMSIPEGKRQEVLYCHFQKRKIEIDPAYDKEHFYFCAPGMVTSDFSKVKQYRMKELKFELSYLYNRIIRKMKKLITGEGVI